MQLLWSYFQHLHNWGFCDQTIHLVIMLIPKTVLQKPTKQDSFTIHNLPCNSFYYFSTKSSHTSLQTTGGNSMHRGTKRRPGDNRDGHKEKHFLSYYRETSVHCSPMQCFPEPMFISFGPPKIFYTKSMQFNQMYRLPTHNIQNSCPWPTTLQELSLLGKRKQK